MSVMLCKLRKLVLPACIAFAVLILAISILPAWWLIDLLANFRPQAAVFGVVLAMGTAFFQKWPLLIISSVSTVLCLWPLASLRLSSSDNILPSHSQPTLSVVSHNVQYKDDVKEHLAYVAQHRPDIVVLQEVNKRFSNEFAPTGYHCVYFPRSDAFGMLACSVLPIDSHQIFPLVDVPALSLRITKGTQTITVLSVHTWPPLTPDYHQKRSEQFAQIAAWSQKQDMPHIIIGDFNATPWSRSLHTLQSIGLINSHRGNHLQSTWGPFWPLRLPIDLCFLSQTLTVIDRTIGPLLGSDHNMQTVTFGIAEKDK